MENDNSLKKSVWTSLFRLILPFKKRFLLVVTLGLLSTGANLIEPLIYREAINDVAGLFVQQAKHDARQEMGVDDDDVDPVTSFLEKKIDAPPVNPVKKKKEPHRRNHVAGRTPNQALRTLLWATALLFLTNLISYLISLIAENMNVRLACKIEQSFIQNTFVHVLRLPLSFFGKRSSAALARQINQSEEVSAVVNGFSQEIFPEILSLAGILAIMFWQNVTLTLIALAIIPFYILIAWHSANRLESSLPSYYEQWEEVSSRMQDALSGIKTVKLSGAEEREKKQFQKIADGAYNDYVLRAKLANKYTFWENTLTQISTALVLGYGGYLTLEHKLTPGDVVMFVAYLDRLYAPIDTLASLWVNLQQNIASIARAFKLLDNGVEEKKGKELTVEKGNVEFRNVHFGYTPEREILKGISFTLAPGKVTAIVGPSGAGKTTTVDLLMKLYEPLGGEVLIDGENLTGLDAASVRRQIGMVTADGAIFHGTLAYNIRYKRPDASDEEVHAAALSAGMQNTLQRLPEGLETPVGENGIGLSVGERQRIQIARILVSQPRILILDEATANLDYATEVEIKKTVNEIRKENTVILIAHRYSMVRDADHIIVLSGGEVLEQGSTEELISRGGWFANFAQNASQGDEKVEENAAKDEMEEGDSTEEIDDAETEEDQDS